MRTLIDNIAYYAENEGVLREVLDDMVEIARVETDDLPAFAFATLASALDRNHGKAVTVAALALMRLAERTDGGDE